MKWFALALLLTLNQLITSSVSASLPQTQRIWDVNDWAVQTSRLDVLTDQLDELLEDVLEMREANTEIFDLALLELYMHRNDLQQLVGAAESTLAGQEISQLDTEEVSQISEFEQMIDEEILILETTVQILTRALDEHLNPVVLL